MEQSRAPLGAALRETVAEGFFHVRSPLAVGALDALAVAGSHLLRSVSRARVSLVADEAQMA